jgi:uncharacterized protein (DUF1800 family)
MKLKSKPFILSLVLWLSWLSSSSANPTVTDAKILHLLNRLSYGSRPGEINQVQSMGIDRYIQQQLSPQTIPLPQTLNTQLNNLKTLNKTPAQLVRDYAQPRAQDGQKPSESELKAARQRARQILEEATHARLLRAIESPRQLEEIMVDFWFNHFNVDVNKGFNRVWVGAYEAQAIRPYALGRFRDLLTATARHPAMLFYLDNWQNTDPNSKETRGQFQGLNENYARELMELHTLGVEGGYTQEDVVTLAKIFTGWGFPPGMQRNQNFEFYFDANRHDFTDKVFLGKTIKGNGISEGEQALEILAGHPATARHISYKLAQYFVADQPPNSLVEKLTQRFLQTDGEIRAVLETLFNSSEFWDAKYYNVKFKTPYQYVVSAVRATGTEINNTEPLTRTLLQLGMPLYGASTPDGYKNTEEAWLNPDAISRRIEFATLLGSGRLPLQTLPNQQKMNPNQGKITPIDATQLAQTLGNNFSANTQETLKTSPQNIQAALILGSPEFMRR